MLIRERMTRNPVLCAPDLSVTDAFDLMKKVAHPPDARGRQTWQTGGHRI